MKSVERMVRTGLAVAVPIALLGSCDALFGPLDDTWEPDLDDTSTGSDSPGCPDDLDEPAASLVSVRSLTINGSDHHVEAASAPWDAVPAVCVSSDGLRAQVLLEFAGEPFVWLRSYAHQAGSNDLVGGTGVEVEAFGLQPPVTWSDGSWSSGRWSVIESDGTWTHALSANGTSGSDRLNVEAYLEVTP